MTLPGIGMEKGAVVNGDYRYSLTRSWGAGPRALWVMLNPSTADADQDDPTLGRCTTFSQREGAGSLEIVNLFALRTPKPIRLTIAREPVGEMNDQAITDAAMRADWVVCAWGQFLSHPQMRRYRERDETVLELIRSSGPPGGVLSLGTTGGGHPCHPLYLAGDTPLVPYPGARP